MDTGTSVSVAFSLPDMLNMCRLEWGAFFLLHCSASYVFDHMCLLKALVVH